MYDSWGEASSEIIMNYMYWECPHTWSISLYNKSEGCIKCVWRKTSAIFLTAWIVCIILGTYSIQNTSNRLIPWKWKTFYLLSFHIIAKVCRNINALLCVKFQNEWPNGVDDKIERYFVLPHWTVLIEVNIFGRCHCNIIILHINGLLDWSLRSVCSGLQSNA